MDDSLLLDLLPDYVLNVLAAEERAEVDALLARSAPARSLLRDYEQTLGGLTLLVPARKAPAHLTADFARLLQVEAQPAPPPRTTAPLRTFRLRPALWRAVLAAAVLILVVGGLVVRADLDSLQERNTTQTLIASIIHDQAVRQTALAFNDPTLAARVTLYTLSGSADAVIAMENMPPLADGKQYQVWLIADSAPVSVGAFSPDPAEPLQLVHLSGSADPYKQVAITIEPTGGSPQPTSKPIAAGKLNV